MTMKNKYIEPETTIINCSLYDYIYISGFNQGLETAVESMNENIHWMTNDIALNLEYMIEEERFITKININEGCTQCHRNR